MGEQILKEDAAQYRSVGLQLGERYELSNIVAHDLAPAPADHWDTLSGVLRSGARAPHVWLSPGVSCFDHFGLGFTLINMGQAQAVYSLSEAAQRLGLPLKTLQWRDLVIEDSTSDCDQPHRDSGHAREVAPKLCIQDVYTSTLVLIRPDQHVAWHGEPGDVDGSDQAQALWSLVLGAQPLDSHPTPERFTAKAHDRQTDRTGR